MLRKREKLFADVSDNLPPRKISIQNASVAVTQHEYSSIVENIIQH